MCVFKTIFSPLYSSSASNSSTTSSQAPKRTSSRLRDPELAAKHKAFLQSVTVATNGTMESFLEQEANKKMESASPSLKRKASSADLTAGAGAQAGNDSKRRRSARNNSSGQV